MTNEVVEECGSDGNINFHSGGTLYDSDNNEILCACGNRSTGCMIAKESYKVWCTACDPCNNMESAKFVYIPPKDTTALQGIEEWKISWNG